MIKITHNNLGGIADAYIQEIIPEITHKANVMRTVLEIFSGHATMASLNGINRTTLKSLANVMLRAKIGRTPVTSQIQPGRELAYVRNNQLVIAALLDYLSQAANLEQLLNIAPTGALSHEQSILAACGINQTTYNRIKPIVKAVINYKLFSKYAYGIAFQLGLAACPYCNRIPINTVVDRTRGKVLRPTFDHFYSQKDNPLLALSFYNLVPSCYFCNSNLKGTVVMSLNDHLHPYLEGFDNDFYFSHLVIDNLPDKSDPRNYKILLKHSVSHISPKFRKVKFDLNPAANEKRGNANLFALQEVYQSHCDTVGELIVRCDAYSNGHANSLFAMFNIPNTNKADFYRYYFGNYFRESEFNKRTLAKLSKDIVKRMVPEFAFNY